MAAEPTTLLVQTPIQPPASPTTRGRGVKPLKSMNAMSGFHKSSCGSGGGGGCSGSPNGRHRTTVAGGGGGGTAKTVSALKSMLAKGGGNSKSGNRRGEDEKSVGTAKSSSSKQQHRAASEKKGEGGNKVRRKRVGSTSSSAADYGRRQAASTATSSARSKSLQLSRRHHHPSSEQQHQKHHNHHPHNGSNGNKRGGSRRDRPSSLVSSEGSSGGGSDYFGDNRDGHIHHSPQRQQRNDPIESGSGHSQTRGGAGGGSGRGRDADRHQQHPPASGNSTGTATRSRSRDVRKRSGSKDARKQQQQHRSSSKDVRRTRSSSKDVRKRSGSKDVRKRSGSRDVRKSRGDGGGGSSGPHGDHSSQHHRQHGGGEGGGEHSGTGGTKKVRAKSYRPRGSSISRIRNRDDSTSNIGPTPASPSRAATSKAKTAMKSPAVPRRHQSMKITGGILRNSLLSSPWRKSPKPNVAAAATATSTDAQHQRMAASVSNLPTVTSDAIFGGHWSSPLPQPSSPARTRQSAGTGILRSPKFGSKVNATAEGDGGKKSDEEGGNGDGSCAVASPRSTLLRSPSRVQEADDNGDGSGEESEPARQTPLRSPSRPPNLDCDGDNDEGGGGGGGGETLSPSGRPSLGLRKPTFGEKSNDGENTNSDVGSPADEARPGLGVKAPSLRELDSVSGDDDDGDGHKSLSKLFAQEHSPRSLVDEADRSYAESRGRADEDDDDSDTDDDDDSGGAGVNQSDDDTVLQFDPTMDSNVFRVKQVVNDKSNFTIENADGTSTCGHIAEIVDPLGDAAQHLLESSSSRKKKELPIFDFLDPDDEEDDVLDFSTPYNITSSPQRLSYPSGGEEERPEDDDLDVSGAEGPQEVNDEEQDGVKDGWGAAEKNEPAANPASPSGGEEEPANGNEEEDAGDAAASTFGTGVFAQFGGGFGGSGLAFPSGGEKEDNGCDDDDDLDSWFPEVSVPAKNDASLPLRRPSGAGDEEMMNQQQPRRKVKRKVIKKKPAPGAHRGDDSDEENGIQERQRRPKKSSPNKQQKKKKPLVRKPSGGVRDDGAEADVEASVNYDTDFSLDNVVVAPPPPIGKPFNHGSSGNLSGPLSPAKIVNNLYKSIHIENDNEVAEDEDLTNEHEDEPVKIEENEDGSDSDSDSDSDESDSDDSNHNICRPPQPGEAPFTCALAPISPANSKAGKMSLGLSSSIGRYFARSRKNTPGVSGSVDGDDTSVSSRSIGSRLFRRKEKHQLLGDDDCSVDSGVPF